MRLCRSMTIRIVAGGLTGIILACVLGMTSSPSLADKKQVVAFKPAINALVDVLTPQGSPRTYTTATGTTYWSPGSSLVIYKGDKIKLKVFVSTGAFELQHVKVRLDNVPIVSIDHQPWETVCDTSTLDTGYHMFQVWAQSDSPSPYSSSEQNIAFYVAMPNQESAGGPDVTSPAPTPVPAPSTAPPEPGATPTAPVPATTMTPPPGPDAMAPAAPKPAPPAMFALPKLIADSAQNTTATVSLQAGSTAPVVGDNATPVNVSGPTAVTVGVPKGSTSSRFVYALYRDGATIYQCDRYLPVYGTQIRLQARSGSSPGLLPGDIILKAWGVDPNGGYGPETSIAVRIIGNSPADSIR